MARQVEWVLMVLYVVLVGVLVYLSNSWFQTQVIPWPLENLGLMGAFFSVISLLFLLALRARFTKLYLIFSFILMIVGVLGFSFLEYRYVRTAKGFEKPDFHYIIGWSITKKGEEIIQYAPRGEPNPDLSNGKDKLPVIYNGFWTICWFYRIVYVLMLSGFVFAVGGLILVKQLVVEPPPVPPIPMSPIAKPSMNAQFDPDDVDFLVDILASRASEPLVGTPQRYFTDLVTSAHLPREWRQDIAGRWSGNANQDARELVSWAINQKINPDNPSYTTLGALLRALVRQKLSPDDARTVVAMMVGYGLITDKKKLAEINIRYGVPVQASTPVAAEINYGPDFDFRGPASDLELQGFLTPDLPWLDVGFLRRAIECSSSICRIEIGKISGTGFLVGPALVLTNYHVLKLTEGDDIQANARKAIVRFAAFTSDKGDAEEGLPFKLDEDPIVEQSMIEDLDFVLLRVEPKILTHDSIKKVVLDPKLPASKSALNILHHPNGGTMKLSTSGNGVTGVYEDTGLIQYVTKAAEGSSGSPCFTDDWKVVALHHAQRSRVWGSVREGILMQAVLARIHQHLDD